MTMAETSEPTIDEWVPRQQKIAKPNFGYYRQSNGYITVAQTSPMEEMNYMKLDRCIRMPEYGSFDMTTEYAAHHPFELLFINGGAKEMPVEQVLELGFHVSAPIIPRCRQRLDQMHRGHDSSCYPGIKVTFPQLADADTTVYPCTTEGCNRSRSGNELPSAEALKNHTTVMHSDDSKSVKNGSAIGQAIVEGLRAAGIGQNLNSVLSKIKLTEVQKAELIKLGIEVE